MESHESGLGKDAIMIYLNDHFIKTIKVSCMKKQQIGFRSGMRSVLIDNVVIREHGSAQLIKEGFDNWDPCILVYVFGLMVLINYCLSFLLSWSFIKVSKEAFFWVIKCNLCFVVII